MILNGYRPMPTGTTAGWKKAKYPLFEPALNTMFDSYVIKEDGIYKCGFPGDPLNPLCIPPAPTESIGNRFAVC